LTTFPRERPEATSPPGGGGLRAVVESGTDLRRCPIAAHGRLRGDTPSVHPWLARRPEIMIMADYGCFTWTSSPELFVFRSDEGLDLARLGVSPDLARRLGEWHKEWEEENYTGVAVSAEASETWEQRGWALARELQAQLTDIDVSFRCRRRVKTDPLTAVES
jgi:hypothetical protein